MPAQAFLLRNACAKVCCLPRFLRSLPELSGRFAVTASGRMLLTVSVAWSMGSRWFVRMVGMRARDYSNRTRRIGRVANPLHANSQGTLQLIEFATLVVSDKG